VINLADPRLPAAMEERARTGRFNGELTFIREDNTVFPVFLSSRIFTDSSGQVKSNIFFVDITEHRNNEKALSDSEANLRAVLNATDESIILMTPEGIIIDLNETAALRIGGTRETLIGRDMTTVFPSSVKKNRSGYISTAVSTGRKVVFEDERDGRWLVNHLVPIQSPDGTVLRIAVFSQDITEQKLAGLQLLKMNETLEERVAQRTRELEAINKKLSFHILEIEQFTYIASHDLQEPLRAMVNYSHLLEDNYAGNMDDEGHRYLSFIRGSAVRMKALVKGLLDYSLIGRETVSSAVACNTLVSDVIHEMADLTRAVGAVITVQKLPVIHGYATELKLLFHNLLANAIKFRKEGIPPEIHISATTGADGATFTVRDNGIGIAVKDSEKIFSIFRRMHNRDKYEGIGVGLALCKKIVELHGGKIRVESTPGEGSSFIFTVPK
jgi:PAS domain S-box-containing protein